MFTTRWNLTLLACLLILLSLPISAQARRRKARVPSPPIKEKAAVIPAESRSAQIDSYLPGEAIIRVRGDQRPVIRIGMAPSGITIIEFPANDRFFAVHPPENGDWIQVEKSPSLKTDHHLVLRAGKDLMSATGPAASASVQMRSGLVLTFWIYPVKQITEQTHRCIITYDRAEIVSARRRAGLSVNLGEEDENESAKAERKIEPAAAAEETQARVHTPTVEKAEAGAAAPVPAALQPSVVADVEKGDDKRPSGAGDMQTAARTLLSGAAADPKQFRKWTTPLHGLTVSARCVDLDEHSRIAIVAVKNVRGEAIRVLPGYPELFVETLDDKGRAFHISPVKKLHFESTNQSSVITAGSTLYYAVVYTAPILGTKQRLRVAVGQMSAADEPVAVGLTDNPE